MMYQHLTSELLDQPSGWGLLNSNLSVDGFALDSGVLQTVFMLGFAGAALFGSGILLACVALTRRRLREVPALSPEQIAYRAIVLASLAKLIGEMSSLMLAALYFGCALGCGWGLHTPKDSQYLGRATLENRWRGGWLPEAERA